MRSSLAATTLALVVSACSGGSPPAAPPPPPAPSAAPDPAASGEPSAPAEAAPTRPLPTAPRALGQPTLYAADVGGLLRHGDVLVRFGSGATAVYGHVDRARCDLSIEESTNTLPAGEWRTLTIGAAPASPADAEFCARFAGSFTSGHPSDPAAGSPPPAPTFDGAECWLRPQITSDGDAMCASFAEVRDAASPDAPATLTASLYEGTCCVGTARGTRSAPSNARGFLLTSDGSTLVAAVHDAMIESGEISANPVLFTVLGAEGSTELHLNDLFAGDPVLTAGSSFAVEVHLEARELVVRAAGGEEHRRSL